MCTTIDLSRGARVAQQRFDFDGKWQETECGGGWTVREEFVLEGGRYVVSSLLIRPTLNSVPPGGVTARFLRKVKVGQFASGLRQAFTEHFGKPVAAHVFEQLGWPPRTRRRPRRSRAPDRYYADLAFAYVQLRAQGNRSPIQTLARRHRVPPKLMRSHIHLARANGFLSDTKRGAAGGTLTQKAQQELTK